MHKAIVFKKPRAKKGFTLIELVVAVAIFAAMAGVVVDLLAYEKQSNDYDITLDRMNQLSDVFRQYAQDTIKCRLGNFGNETVIGSLPSTGTWPSDIGADLEATNSTIHYGAIHVDQGIPVSDSPPNIAEFGNLATMARVKDLGDYIFGLTEPVDCWQGPYLSVKSELLRDAWGNDFYYISPTWQDSTTNQAIIYLYSKGPDGKFSEDFDSSSPGTIELSEIIGASGLLALMGDPMKMDDDVLMQIPLGDIWDQEAERRVEKINEALTFYKSFVLANPSVGSSSTKAPYVDFSTAITEQMANPFYFNPVNTQLTSITTPDNACYGNLYHFLRNTQNINYHGETFLYGLPEFIQNPWRVDKNTTLLECQNINSIPYDQVGFTYEVVFPAQKVTYKRP